MTFRCFVLLLSLLGSEAIFCQNNVFELPINEGKGYVTSMDILEDTSMMYTLQSVLSPEVQNNFIPFSGDPGILNPKTEIFWVKLSIYNPGEIDQNWILNFGPNWSRVEVFTIDSTGTINEGPLTTGTHVAFNQRNYPVANQTYVLLNFPEKNQRELLIKLDASNTELNSFSQLSPAFQIANQSVSDREDANRKLWIGVFSAIFFFMFIYHMFVSISTWRKTYVFYLGLIATYFFLPLGNSGYIVEMLSWIPSFPKHLNTYILVCSSLTGLLTILFMRELLQTKKRLPKSDIILLSLFGILLFLFLLQLLFKAKITYLVLPFVIIQYIIITIVAIIAFIKRIPSSGYYLLAYGFSIVGVLIFFLSLGGAIPFNEITYLYGPAIGWALEILFFSFAIANIINVLKKENEISQAKYIEKLKENEALQTKINRELEEKVKERTMEIQKQKDLLEIEKENSDKLLLNILPETVASELKQKGNAAPKYYLQVSVLFTDFQDFSRLSSNLSSDNIVKNLDECFRVFDEITDRYKLEKIKTIGDSYMCAGGIPVPFESSALSTVKAAMEMNKFIEDWNKKKEANGEQLWLMRIGIHTGAVTAGIVGKNKFAFDIWGNTVNIASRIENAGQPGKINISAKTWELVKDHFEGDYRGKIETKNREKIEMYFVEEKEKDQNHSRQVS